jgi:cell division protein FtsI/penicillin-binding protein 2
MYYFHKTNKSVNFNRRVNIFLLGFLLFFVVIVVRLVTIQIIDSEKYQLAAKKQYLLKETINPVRGLIFDRNMNLLVSNTYKFTVAADPNMVKNYDSLSSLLAGIFNKDKNEYLTKLQARNSSYVVLEKKLESASLKGLDTMNIEGLIVKKEYSRVYNYGSLASHILGITGNDYKGISGLEYSMNKELSGKEGYMLMLKDGKGNKRPNENYPTKEAQNGDNLVLTIDINIQKLIEEELSKGITEFKADGGRVVVLSVKSGEILAMSSYPTFDPNNIQPSDTLGMKNSVIADVFEPGSTFKLVTAAASIEENIESRSSLINTESGNFEYHGIKVDDSHKSGSMTFQQVIEQSSNIGFMKIADKLGAERFYKYARDFGFGIYSGLELPGENKGLLKRPIDFSKESVGFMAIGYQVQINSMQLSSAYASLGNKGMLMKPYIVKKELSPDGTLVLENNPVQVRQVISEKTANTLSELLTGVVDRGTATYARIEGLKIAGKTGTSQKFIDGGYANNSHLSSFVGYFPADNPIILVCVILDNPKSGEYYGGKVSAPIFKNITQRIVDYFGCFNLSNPQFVNLNFEKNAKNELNNVNLNNDIKYIPNLVDLKLEDALELLKENKLKYDIITDAKNPEKTKDYFTTVVSQVPEAYEKIKNTDDNKVKLYVASKKIDQNKLIKVPDVRNYTLRKAINKLISEGFKVEIRGSGEIVDQFPKPGAENLPDSKVVIHCKNEL